MVAMEIVLLIAGGIIFILSFIVPVKREEMSKETRQQVQSEIKGMVSDEMNGAKSRIEDIVDETVNYSIEKTERALDRLTNEKIMAVNEYSDTVLEEINKNHKEVMFLYDMLNDKHQNIKSTVSQVEKKVKEAEQTAKEAAKEVEAAVKEGKTATVQPADPAPVHPVTMDAAPKADSGQAGDDFVMLMPQKVSAQKAIKRKAPVKGTASDSPEMDISFMKEGRKSGGNNNERILEMHNDGKSNVAIAKALGLGVGEVKLVIDLFEGM